MGNLKFLCDRHPSVKYQIHPQTQVVRLSTNKLDKTLCEDGSDACNLMEAVETVVPELDRYLYETKEVGA